MIKGAEISKDKKYRYSLTRIWRRAGDKVMFIMLNPSTADNEEDDPTIRRCIRYARDWNYGGLVVCNLFAYRSTDPGILRPMGDKMGHDFIIGPENDKKIMECSIECDKIIYAWGARGYLFQRDRIY